MTSPLVPWRTDDGAFLGKDDAGDHITPGEFASPIVIGGPESQPPID